MLVLGRSIDESIIIGGIDGYPKVKVIVVDVRGNAVRLGIEAPRDVSINREEVYERRTRGTGDRERVA